MTSGPASLPWLLEIKEQSYCINMQGWGWTMFLIYFLNLIYSFDFFNFMNENSQSRSNKSVLGNIIDLS